MSNLRNYAMNEHLFLFREGKEALEEFENEERIRRGIKRRFKHDFKHDIEGLSIHDGELLAQLQEGHKHTTLYEAVMLLEGEIKACCWDDEGRIETKSLSKRGDLAVFPPGQSHTLFVKQESRVIVVRFFPKAKARDDGEKITVPLPGELESLRRKTLDTRHMLKEILQQIEQELERKKR